jgi:hypothetical protein
VNAAARRWERSPDLDDLTAYKIDRAWRTIAGGPVRGCRVVLADLAAEANRMIDRLAEIVRAARAPLDAGAAEVLRGASVVFLSGESSDAGERAIRDRIEAVADAAAEVADAIEGR